MSAPPCVGLPHSVRKGHLTLPVNLPLVHYSDKVGPLWGTPGIHADGLLWLTRSGVTTGLPSYVVPMRVPLRSGEYPLGHP